MSKLDAVLTGKTSVGIAGHVRPDGDCVGSCVGLGQYIRENYSDKTVDIYLKDIPESFHFLNGTETILESVDNEEKIYDLFISLDCGDTDRLEYSKPLFVKAKHTSVCSAMNSPKRIRLQDLRVRKDISAGNWQEH